MQERLERSGVGQLLISIFVVVTIAGIVMTTSSDSELKSQFVRVGQPYLNALGLDQSWNVFAPDPRQKVIDVEGRVRFADGSTSTWKYPRRDPFVGVYSDYRWRKWTEWVTSDAYRDLWKPAAAYIARQEASAGRRPVSVTLVRRSRGMIPPGTNRPEQIWEESSYYTLEVTPEILEGNAG